MLARAGRYIREKGLLSDGDRVLLMVSGGADSVLMTHMLNGILLAADPGLPQGFQLGICHVNYGRRGGESDADEASVRLLGDRLGIPVHTVRAPHEDRPNFQAWARDFRYLAAQNLCRWQGYSRIAVAHNRDDRIETFIYRLLTYSGRRSLVVMPPRRGRVIRPLLFLTSAEVRDHCRDAGIAYREDSSNQSLDYSRNRIRNRVLPRLEEIRPDYRERISDTLSLLEDEDEVLESVTGQAWMEARESCDGRDCLSATALSLMPRAVARLVIRRWLAGAGLAVRISRRLLDSVVDLCGISDGTSSVTLARGLQVRRQYDTLQLVTADAAIRPPEPVTLTVPGNAVFGRYEIDIIEAPAWELGQGDPLQVTVDGDKLESTLTVRSWQAGDRFTPLGLAGTKSVQDLFTDEKVPRDERAGVPIVISGDDIVWVCGVRVAETFKVSGGGGRPVGLRISRRSD